jgi:carbon-monoxide dehydrogenase large subunit
MAGSVLGHPVRRVEDPRFLTGAACYVEDVPAEGALHAIFVRSFLAHARITGIDVSEASSMPGVVRVLTAADLGSKPLPPVRAPEEMARPILASDVVRFMGERVAVVVAETRSRAVDAAERVAVSYDPLPVVTDALAARDPGAPLLFPEHGSNVVAEDDYGSEPVSLEEADVVVRARFCNQRVAPVPLETNAVLAIPTNGRLELWVSCQAQFSVRRDIAKCLGIDLDRVDVVSPAVGGGFGAKIDTYPEHVAVAALALELGRPVRYVETRTENLGAMTHGRDQIQDVELGATTEGTLIGLRAHVVADLGAYPQAGALLPELTHQMLSGVYRIPRIECTTTCVVTNKTPVSAYRGAGRPEAAALLERAVDMLAAELGMDPAEIRRRNLIEPDAFPYSTPTKARYDSGDYTGVLHKALEAVGYDKLRAEQRRRRERDDGDQLGIGISTYVEVTGLEGPEYGAVEVRGDGTVVVTTGVSPHGQGHETAFSQVVSAKLGVPLESITVVHSDTRRVRRGTGTMGSRSLQLGGSAISNCADAVIAKAKRIASAALEVSTDDLEVLHEGGIGVAGAPQRALPWSELAQIAADPYRRPRDEEPGLAQQDVFEPEDFSYPFGAHVSVVEVDTETGKVTPLRHVAVDDCGRILNPTLVEGQVHGGIAQGMGQALYEEIVYDEQGQLLTGHLGYYRMASPAEICSFERAYTETPSPINPLGAKGIGESAAIGSTPAIQNAVIDALSHLGVRHIDMPLTPERVWRALLGPDGRPRSPR